MKRVDLTSFAVNELLERFADIAIAQDEAELYSNIRKVNRLFDRLNEIEMELRGRGDDAALALVEFYNHPNAQVRLASAQRSRDLAPALARKVFEKIIASREYPQSADAAMSLRNMDEGVPRPARAMSSASE